MDISSRATNVQELSHQLDVLESVVIGPYVLGDTMSAGDAAIFPTLVHLPQLHATAWPAACLQRL